MSQIAFAHIAYKDDTKRFLTVPISDVKYKRNSENHITPKNDDDFQKRQVYYVAWRDCDEKCKKEHEHVGYYPAFILLLGGSIEEIKNKVETGGRLIIPNKIESSESEENVKKSRKIKRTTSIQDVQNHKNKDILERYSHQSFMSSRKKLGDSDDETQSIEESTSSMICNIQKGERNKKVVKHVAKTDDQQYNGDQNLLAAITIGHPKDENKKLKEELESKSKQIDDLQQIIHQLQEKQNCLQLSTITTGDTRVKGSAVKRKLFSGEDDDEAEGSRQLGKKLQIRRVEKVHLHEFNKLTKHEQKKGDQHLRLQTPNRGDNANVSSVCENSKVKPPPKPIIEPIEAGCSRSISPIATVGGKSNRDLHNRRQIDNRTPTPSENEDSNNSTEDDTDIEDVHQELEAGRCSLEPKMKRRKTNDFNAELNRKIIRDINEALQFYNGQEIDEHGRKRYDVNGDRIYLGEGIQASANTWFLIQHNKPTIFFRDMVELLWGRRKLVNRCQNLKKVTTKLLDRSPIKALTPEKKRLAYKLYSDHLDRKRISGTEKMKFMMEVPLLYSRKINYLRSKYYK